MTAQTDPSDDHVATFTIHGEPASKSRPRFTSKGRVYTPAATVQAEREIAAAYVKAGGRLKSDTNLAYRVEAEFHQGTHQRRDVDNMLKLVLDGLNKVAWPDDAQVLEVRGRKSFGTRDEARTTVSIYRHGDMGKLRGTCPQCGTVFETYPSWNNPSRRKVFCSRACTYAKSRADRARTCEHCGDAFTSREKTNPPRFCSAACKNRAGRVTIPCTICGTEFEQYRSWVTQRPCCSPECSRERATRTRSERASRHFPGTCRICGAGTTRREYRRCNPCKLAGKSTPGEVSA